MNPKTPIETNTQKETTTTTTTKKDDFGSVRKIPVLIQSPKYVYLIN